MNYRNLIRANQLMLMPVVALVVAVFFLGVSDAELSADDDGFVSIFDGKTLAGWDGNPKLWRVEDNAITGQTTKENPTKGNTFIVWRGIPRSSLWQQAQQNLRQLFPQGNPLIEPRPGVTDNFELKLEYRIIGGNSGIQYRSLELPDQKWVISGYQADFEAGDTYSGILYSEKARGILAKRGEKTIIGKDGKPKVVGSVGDTKKIQANIKKEDWNAYHIIANGNHFVHKINGMTTVDVTDNDIDGPKRRRASGVLALQLHAGPPMKVQFRNIRIKVLGGSNATTIANADTPPSAPVATTSKKLQSNPPPAPVKKVVKSEKPARKRVAFVAGTKSHGYGSHEHKAGCLLLAKSLERAMPNFDTIVYTGGWPKDPNALDGFDALVMYSDGGGGHMINRNLAQIDKLMQKGVGLVCIHYAVEVPQENSGEKFLDWIGGYFEANWSVNPHWTPKFTKLPKHPITRGVKPFSLKDEWYYHMRFPKGMKGVTPILTDLPPKSTLSRPDGPHSGNSHVRKAVANGQVQHVAWAKQRENGGRGFGFTGGHDHWNWGNDNFRRLVLNAIVWTAHGEVQQNGVPTKSITMKDLEANQDYGPSKNFSREKIEKLLADWRSTIVAK